jgi:hypothetical protein
MKSIVIAVLLGAAAAAIPALAQTSVSISVGQPNFYGRIDIGDYARPPVYYAQPVIVERQVRYIGQPVYLRVPEGHRKHWNKHCRKYNACGQQVFFVQDGWYNNTYAPHYRETHRGHDEAVGHGKDKHKYKDEFKHKDKGKGKDKDHGKHGD